MLPKSNLHPIFRSQMFANILENFKLTKIILNLLDLSKAYVYNYLKDQVFEG